jgi:hypothetical protein
VATWLVIQGIPASDSVTDGCHHDFNMTLNPELWEPNFACDQWSAARQFSSVYEVSSQKITRLKNL